MAILQQLEANEWSSREEIEARQLQSFDALLRHHLKTSPFYGEHARQARSLLGAELDWDAFHQVPILTRTIFQDAGDALYSTAPPDNHGDIQILRTSGACGQNVSVRRTRVSNLILEALSLRNHLWQGRDLDKSLAHVQNFAPGYEERGYAKYPAGASEPNWATGYLTGPVSILDAASCSIDDQLEWLMRKQPSYLQTYPTNLAWLAMRCEDRGITLPGLQGVLSYSETVTQAHRNAVQRVWGLRISDVYSAMEVGLVAAECPDHPDDHYLVQEDNMIVEVLDDYDKPCAPGEIGRVIVTDLNNYATPVIRYDIGDFAEVAPLCPAGRQTFALRRIVGRTRHMLRLRNGQRAVPYTMNKHDFTPLAPIRQVQLAQISLDEIEFRYSSTRPLTDGEVKAVLAMAEDALPFPFNFRAVRLPEIPRLPGGKFLEFSYEIED